ncbi:MAG: DUF4270 domain-containing protein [Alistipes sp.]|nr:DUF4270 domain-containing protein [Alistipes sp.]
MKRFNNILRPAAAALGAAMLLGSCTKTDDTLGANLIPTNQQMKAGYASLPGISEVNPKKYVETRLFRTDSIVGSNISTGYFGTMYNDTLGRRSAGFLSQYISYYRVDSGYFGFRPIFDSAQLLLSINAYGGDTTSVQEFAVYEITSNDYLTKKPIAAGKSARDTTFYLGFDPTAVRTDEDPALRIIGDEVLFTFELGGDKGPSTTAVTMQPTEAGKKFVKRLMLQGEDYREGDPIDYSVYSVDSLEYFVDRFKGLYIVPTSRFSSSENGATKGTIYATDLSATGLSIFGRNRRKEDPALIKDTIGMVYYFYDTYQSEYGNVSANAFKHEYEVATSPARLYPEEMDETNTDRPENPRIYVEGMGGAVTELTLTQAFFDELDALIEAENALSDKDFNTLAFSQALVSIYFPASHYDWTQIDPANPGRLIEEMNSAPSRLGLYTDYKRLTAIADYQYVYEQSYSQTIAYGGYINRSRGCYVMDITAYMQGVWNNYLRERKAAESEGRAVDLTKVANRTIYLGPSAYDLFTASNTVLQGAADDMNRAPIRFDLTYNLVK